MTQKEYEDKLNEIKGKIEELLTEYKMTLVTSIGFKSTDINLTIEPDISSLLVPSKKIIKPK